MATYDFFVAGRWRNHPQVSRVVDVVRGTGNTAYCFLENKYEGEELDFSGDIEQTMQKSESMDVKDPMIQKIFAKDIQAERDSDNFLLVFPAGKAGHIEAGVAYGLGKKCYAVGIPEKTETLYAIFEEIFPDEEALKQWLEKRHGK